MRARLKRHKLITLACFFCLAVIVGVGITTAGASDSGKVESTVKAPAVGTATPQLSQAAISAFGVFSQPAGDSQDVSLVSEMVKGFKDVTLDPASVRLAQSSGDLQARVAGDSESICLVLRVPTKAMSGGCAPESSAASPATPIITSTGYPPGEPSDGQVAVSVLFPNGTTNVTITAANGSTTAANIVNNTIVFIGNQSDVLTWTGPEGHQYSSSLPS